MRKIVYNKLVRDNIVDIIISKGKVKSIESKIICKEHELKPLLFDKLQEECRELTTEYNKTNELSLEELADVLEVIDAIKEKFNIDEAELDKVKKHKALVKGRFKQGVYLGSVESIE